MVTEDWSYSGVGVGMNDSMNVFIWLNYACYISSGVKGGALVS